MSDHTINPNGKGIKISIDFPDISHSEAEKRTLAKFRELHDKDYLPLTLKIWITLFAVGALTIALICLIVINADFFDSIPVWFWTILTLASVASLLIFRTGRKDRKKAPKDF